MRRAALLLVGAVAFTAAVALLVSPFGPVAARSEQAVGVVIRVDSAGLADVRGFVLRTADGTELRFTLGRLENGDRFPPGHLAEHAATAAPIRVSYHLEGGTRVVTRLEDAS